MDPPEESLSVWDVEFDVPKALALRLSKDQRLRFSGQIESVMNVLGSCAIQLEDASVK